MKEETPDPVVMERLSIELTVYYAVQPPEAPPEQPPALLLALHGWGQNCKRFIRDFAPLRSSDILVVAPQAPHQFYLDMASKKVGFNWLTVYDRDQAIADVNGYLRRLLDVLHERRAFDPKRLFVLGFSQGVSMAYRFAVSGLCAPAGLISCCADIAPDVVAKLPHTKPFPVLLARGLQDGVFPEEKVAEAQAALTDHGFPAVRFDFPEGHELTPGLMARIGEWIEETTP